ncbi:cytochrome c biogenesis CcdA family protein [Phormidesmis sp. 146-35]
MLSISLSLLAGILTVLSPCVLPILPILVGGSLQSHRLGPVALVVGLVSGFAVAGSVIGLTASWVTELANWLRFGAIGLLLILGTLAMFPTWSYRLFSYLPAGRLQPSKRVGLWGEFWLGTQLGLLWTPCAGPTLGAILILAAVHHQVISAFGLLLVYGVGAALPLLAIAYGGRFFSQRLLNLRSYSSTLQRIGGLIIVGTAIAILLGWDIQIQLWLAPLFPPLQL